MVIQGETAAWYDGASFEDVPLRIKPLADRLKIRRRVESGRERFAQQCRRRRRPAGANLAVRRKVHKAMGC